MNTPTYKEQFDKLTRAYINNEVKPFDHCACFIGNLLNGKDEWFHCKMMLGRINPEKEEYDIGKQVIDEESNGLYTPEEIIDLEYTFMCEYQDGDGHRCDSVSEERLFTAFENGLEHLKQIHISKGENIEEQFEFKKRELVLNTIDN